MAQPNQIGVEFQINSGGRILNGMYTGTVTYMLDAAGNGEARSQGSGRVIGAAPDFADLFLSHVFVQETIKMVEGEGVGASGTISFRLAS
jgi:hypothetical protein